ncbi:hypothetical protein ASE66_17745 [Bosea sp. Root483D1]|uniref:hypothetical protein n=1 Tax=Bosea sp. Root483D1 TaxID=1736544 RepID=UPI00070E9EC7|nr:hypothetical protein [Bosea sp. Root483D1]KRE12393.1 hypothetical protein ASE66_17745 [Bosea sp. Root483D1]
MMFNLFDAFADRVREQADDYAKAQARIGARTLAHVFDPLGMASAMAGPVLAPAAGTELRPPRLKSERRARRNARPAPKRQLPRRRPALNFA